MECLPKALVVRWAPFTLPIIDFAFFREILICLGPLQSLQGSKFSFFLTEFFDNVVDSAEPVPFRGHFLHFRFLDFKIPQ